MDLRTRESIVRMISLGTKAETLSRLRGQLQHAKVMDVYFFTLADWKSRQDELITGIVKKMPYEKVICRSSGLDEDTTHASNAGKYKSVPDVLTSDRTALKQAIDEVFQSYSSDDPRQQVLVQPQLTEILSSGVIFTADLESGSPYYVVNYDDQTGSTDSVTSGRYSGLQTYVHFKEAPVQVKNETLGKIITAAKELESLLEINHLDIEFAVLPTKEVVIFQVRRLNIRSAPVSPRELSWYLLKIFKKAEKLNQKHPNLYGDRTVFGIMPDWNPAEIIGVKPRMMALSLYKELVTDSIWAYQRNNYGYKNLRSFPLLVSFFGQPYIDVRVSFNSFIPEKIPDALAHKLANHYIQALLKAPALHDKVEFSIVYSCYYLDVESRLSELGNAGFSGEEITLISKELRSLTNNIIHPEKGIYKADQHKVEMLNARRAAILDSDMSLLDKIYWLLEECKRYGTLPFAGLARAGFIAIQFLKSFVSLGIISNKEYDDFLASLNTVARQLNADHRLLAKGLMSREKFLSKYGHLRPGTYDILSARYDEEFEKYFGSHSSHADQEEKSAFSFSERRLNEIEKHLGENKIELDAKQLIRFIREAIELREGSKFIFTRCLSDTLRLITSLGERFGFSKEEMSHLDISVLMKLYSHLDQRDVPEILKENIDLNKKLYAVSRAVRLPHLITTPDDVYAFFLGNDEPNFITQRRIAGDVVSHADIHNYELTDKIVFIPSADPGYDWIFSKKIGGLVTQYGGANSHMAIRCAELSIPAVVGCGEQNYALWSKAAVLEMDCENKQVRIIN